MTLPAAFAGWESLLHVGLWGTSVPGNILVCPSIFIGLCFCSDREATAPAVTLPNKICACISSPFCCFSTLTGSSKVEEQNINNICTQHPWKSHKHSMFYCFLVAWVFFLFTRIVEVWRGWSKLLHTGKCRGKSQNLRSVPERSGVTALQEQSCWRGLGRPLV